MAKVELNIVALGDFSSVNTQIKSLQEQIVLLQKNIAGVGINSNLAKELSNINASFKQTMLSTGQFTASTVTMVSETEKFGQALVNGKLKLTEYYSIIKQKNSEAVTQMKALALEQTKLQNSIVMNDPSKQGILSVYTPTQINKVANATKIATNEANLYAIAVKKGSEQLINWGKNTQWAGRQLTVGMSVPLILFGQQATQVFKDVNDQIVRLQKVYGTGLQQPTKQALDTIKTQTLALGKELAASMGISVKDTAAMAADLAATGKTGNDLIVATREAMRLSKLGELDTQSAMKATVSLQNVYKLSTQELSGAVDFLNAVENQTSTSLQDLVDGIPRVGPIVQQLGGSFKDTAIMMVAMKEAGVPAAQSANAIKSAIASLINPTKGAQTAFAAFHIDLKNIATSTGGNPVQMIIKLQQALKGLAPLAQAQLIEKLFGKFQEARIQALITNLGAANSQTKTAFDLMNANSAQLAAVAAGEMKTATESVTGKYQRSIQTFKADLIPVGEELLKIATKLLDFGNSVAKVFSGLPGPLKSVMGAIAIGIALSGPIIMLTGLFANFAGYVLKGFFNLKQLATGGKTLGTLLTPELIAAENANKLFQAGIAGDVEAVNLLAKAIQDLTLNIEQMVGTLSAGTGFGSVLTNVAKNAKTYEQMKLPGFASGGIVPGSGSGSVDTYPAMLAPGELVVDAATTKKYWPIFNAAINGKIPGYAKNNADEFENIYHGPLTGDKKYSAPSVLGGGAAALIGEDLPAIIKITQSIIQEFDLLGKGLIGAKNASNVYGQFTQMDLGHLSHPEATPGEGKPWVPSQLAGVTHPENQVLEQLVPGQVLHSFIKETVDSMLSGVVKTGLSPEKIQEAAKRIELGQQPIDEAGLEVYTRILQTIRQKVKSGQLDIESGSISNALVAEGTMTARVFPEEAAARGFPSISKPRVLSSITPSFLRDFRKNRKNRRAELQAEDQTNEPTTGYFAEIEAAKNARLEAEAVARGSEDAKVDAVKRAEKKKSPSAVLYDVDQTLAKTKGINKPGESWIDATVNAEPIPEEVERLKRLKAQGHKIVILTARTIHHQEQTIAWLEKNDIPYDELVMRGSGENASDGVFKASKINELKKKYSVKGLVDDKQENLDAAKSVGVTPIPALNGISDEADKAGKVVAESYAKGIKSGKPAVEKAGAILAKEALVSVAKTQKSASKSRVAEQLGINFGQGYDFGILSTAPQATAAGQELAASAILGTEEENLGSTPAGGKLARVKNKFMPGGKMGNMLKFGASSAVMMGGQAISGMLPKGSNLSSISSDASAGASLGMFIGPEGAAVGAAIGAALGGVSALIRAEKEHRAAVESSFTASSSVISAYGGTMIAATQAVYNFNTASKVSSEILSKTAKDVAEINKLQSSSPLKQVGDLIKGYDSASSIIGTVKTFAAAQVAAGMDPKQVSQMVTDLLTYAGKTQYLSAALKEINAGTKDMTTATTTWLNKLKNTGDALAITATKYSDMSKAQKIYADGLLATTNIISDQNTPLETVLSKIKSLSDQSVQSASSVNGFAIALQNAGAAASTVSQVTQWASMGITNMGEIATMLKLSSAGFTNLNSKNAADLTKAVTGDIVKMVEDQSSSSIKSAQAQYDSEVKKYNAAVAAAKTASATAITKAKQQEIDALGKIGAQQYDTDQKLLKVKEAQLNTLKLQTAEMQKQQQYQMSQQDLDSQMKQAQISGDYLKAAGLQQQKNYNASQFGATKNQDALQSEIDALNQSIAASQLKIANYQSSNPASAPVDNSGVIMAKSALDIAKQSGNVKSMVVDINKYLLDSGLSGFKAVIDGKNQIHVIVDNIKSLTGTSANIPGTIGSPLDASKAEDYTKLKNNYGSSVYDSSGQLSKSTSGTKNGLTAANQLVHDLGWAKDTYFTWPNPVTGKNDYYFYSAKDKNAIRLDPSTPGLPTKANGGVIANYAVGSLGGVKGLGTATSDSILARLSNGEYVIKADAVSHYGVGFFDSINAKRFGVSLSKPTSFSSNPVFSSSGSNINAGSQSTVYNINMNVNSNASDPKAVADHVMSQLTVATAKKNVTNTVGRR